VIGGAEEPTAVDGAEHVDAEPRAEGVDELGRAGAGHRGQRGRGWEPQLDPASSLGRGQPPRVRMQHGVEHLVFRMSGLRDEPAAPCARPEHPGTTGEQPHGLLVGAITGRQQLLVEVEEGNHGEIGHASVQDRLGADEDSLAAVLVADGLTEDGVELVAHPAHPDPQVAQPRRSTRRAEHRTLGGAPFAPQNALRLHDRGVAPLAGRDLSTDRACQQPGTPLAVEHADHSARARAADGLQQAVRVQP
jgi:hypothetical protein